MAQEFQIYLEAIRKRLALMDVSGGNFTDREKKILSIVWNRNDELHGEVMEQMAAQALDESGGCSRCGSLHGFDCYCDEEEDSTEECPECMGTGHNNRYSFTLCWKCQGEGTIEG